MGQSTDGKLFYGYDLGGDGADATDFTDEEDAPSWYTNGDTELIVQMKLALYNAIPDAAPVEYEWRADAPVLDYYGVWFEHHCSDSYAMWALVTYEASAARGCPEKLDLAELAARPQREDWDGKLARALEVLGITPKQERPAWLLASYWG